MTRRDASPSRFRSRDREPVGRSRPPPPLHSWLDPTDDRVIVNGRIFKPDEVPLSDIELEVLDENTSFSFVRAMNSRAGKERLWRVLERAVIEVLPRASSPARVWSRLTGRAWAPRPSRCSRGREEPRPSAL